MNMLNNTVESVFTDFDALISALHGETFDATLFVYSHDGSVKIRAFRGMTAFVDAMDAFVDETHNNVSSISLWDFMGYIGGWNDKSGLTPGMASWLDSLGRSI